MIINKIRVLITDDSLLFRNVLKKELSEDPHIEVVGMAVDPVDALEKIKSLKPDILTLDVEMPKMSGLVFLKKLMEENPLKVVLVSSMNISVFDALHAGAVDFVKKPDMSSKNDLPMFFREIRTKIKVASIAKLVPFTSSKVPETKKLEKISSSKVIAIGASTGGTEATLTILKSLPAHMPGILVTQHMPPGFTKMYADRLNKICDLEVREALDGDRVEKGLVLVAPGDKQMKLAKDDKGYYVSCKPGEKVSGHCPSVDVLFNSVAENAGKNSVGIILTGMGKDGAQGLLNMKKTGAFTVGQDEKSSVVYGMPMVAFNIGAVIVQSDVEDIAEILIKHLNK
ncbi:protein-glutamate methylesterase/protein-glutamine glutaminase [Sedimentibacter saalensis]|jgi:two-component system chemotaxis response regulator CheB|uniref:Protein-glutamate methylesterase/protein-glutamine glutaminase n=1 Tax=Sedimentibacter saalensis TaxID=130788 RepID=A0A562J6A6_9FIRM|nr:chemotaxis response regulator protein-glutamate methylesterase [Sedimentibacter saalensis]MEA5095158.1 chemotaxis response regulator protein-glutamate methylesterase [Sedimentibacter saalensis]TWH78711.1 two-component system chemotaxis response regulator CheB [Sedimentibacter saalensis]